MDRLPTSPFVYPLTDRLMAGERDIHTLITQLCSAGARFIQLREKKLSTRDFTELAREAVAAAEPWDALIIINDRCDVAVYAGAHGVHLGEAEIPIDEARRFLGPEPIIGVSCHSIEDVREVIELPVDYIAIGPVFGTASKAISWDPVAPDLIRQARATTDLPIVGIGNINAENAAEVIAAGANGVAVIGAIMQQGLVEKNTADMIKALQKQ